MLVKHLSKQKINKIILCFCEDITVTFVAKFVGVNRNTINAYYNEFRQKIFDQTLQDTEIETVFFELDESYFGVHRVRGKRGRRTVSFGLLKCGEKEIE